MSTSGQTLTKLQRNDGWLREVWRYRELLAFFIWRDISVKYKQTLFGVAWAVLQPLFTMIVFTIFFGRVAKMPSEGIPHPIFYYSALLPWTFLANALNSSGNCLISNENLITKVYFPRLALPASAVLSGLLDMVIASSLLIVMMWLYEVPVTSELAYWPIFVVPLTILALGVGMILSALNVRYRDIKYVLPFLIQIWLFISPVIYSTSLIPERLRFLVVLNPAAGIIDAFRASVVPGRDLDWSAFGISSLASVFVFLLGLAYFRKTERAFADII